MSVTVVLDTTAVIAYTKGSIAVGELLSIIADDGDTAVVPASCLAEAHRRLGRDGASLLGVLAQAPCVTLTPLMPSKAADVGRAAGQTSLDVGHAVIDAVEHDAQVATTDVATISLLLPEKWPIIEL